MANEKNDDLFPKDWELTEEELALLQHEPTPVPKPETNAEIANRLFRDNVAVCAEVIIEIAVNDPSSSRRLSAAKYVVDRVCGSPNSPTMAGAAEEPFSILAGILREPTKEERDSGRQITRG